MSVDGDPTLDGGSQGVTLPINESDVTNLVTDLAATEKKANKDVANGYAGLDAGGLLKTAEFPDLSATYQKKSEKDQTSGYAGLDAGGKVVIGEIPTGSTASTVCIGNDSRLSNKRAPTITSETINDIMYFDGTNWVRLATASGFLKGGSTPTYATIGESDVTNLVTDLAATEKTAHKDQINGYASLDGSGLVPVVEIPSLPESRITNLVSDLAGKLSNALTDKHIFVGNGSNVATDVAMSGEVTISDTGVTTIALSNANKSLIMALAIGVSI